MSNEPGNPPDTSSHFDLDFTVPTSIYENVTQEVVITTSDRIRLCLIRHREDLRAQKDWIAPLGVLLALVAALVAADFKDFLGVKAEVWQALFILGSLASFTWLVFTAVRAIRLHGSGGIETILAELKEGSVGDTKS